LLPARDGDAQDLATVLSQAFNAQQGGQLASLIKVVPLARINAVLVVASQPRYLDDARRAYGVVEAGMHQTTRTWHVYYVQNSTASDTAYILQQAFTPSNVTGQPTARGQGQLTSGVNGITGLGAQSGNSGISGGLGSSGGLASAGIGGSGGQSIQTVVPNSAGNGASALLGGLSNSGGSSGSNDRNAMRIIPDPENNTILVYATGEEEATVEAMLHKIDILPLQVRIDAIIAEVTLNDNLSYGTQFFFDHRAASAGLTTAATAAANLALPATGLTGFVFNAAGKNGDFVLQALQDVTTVKILSSPDLLVLDNETAALSVGNLVPFQTGSLTAAAGTGLATSTSVDYRQTGVITQVTPRVNSGGLVTLDIAQEVSGIAPSGSTASSGSTINSPTFTERAVKSRVVVQDGQTVGLAGLIIDNDSRGNSGLPFLKNIPILNLITSQQSNMHTRTELLILLTPHVLHDQRDARALTEDLREQLPRAALLPYDSRHLPARGSEDPSRNLSRIFGGS
jgi:general secretion pathway protein D